MKTLIVEDDFSCRHVLVKLLWRYGECHQAVNGTEAVAAFRCAREERHPYDLICLDIEMPEMDGQTALRKIRELEAAAGIRSTRGVKVVMVTAQNDPKSVVAAFSELCDGYVFKPVERCKLVAQLETLGLIKRGAPLPRTCIHGGCASSDLGVMECDVTS